jgi:hypothetical protein
VGPQTEKLIMPTHALLFYTKEAAGLVAEPAHLQNLITTAIAHIYVI